MYRVPKQVKGFSDKLNYVDTCPNSPVRGLAFCKEHSDLMESNGVPTKLKEFLEYQKQLPHVSLTSSAADCQGWPTPESIREGDSRDHIKSLVCH